MGRVLPPLCWTGLIAWLGSGYWSGAHTSTWLYHKLRRIFPSASPPPIQPTHLFLPTIADALQRAFLLGLSLGSGDWVLVPVVTARWGTTFLWICAVSVMLQALLNTEMARYTLATGESIFAGFMRGRPGPRLWGSVYTLLHLAQVGWPGWALAAGAALVAAFLGRPLRPQDGPGIVAPGDLIFLGAGFVPF